MLQKEEAIFWTHISWIKRAILNNKTFSFSCIGLHMLSETSNPFHPGLFQDLWVKNLEYVWSHLGRKLEKE